MNDFTIKDRFNNVAFDKGYPSDGSFSCKLMCGYSKYPGHIKPATGEPYFACCYKWPYDYYVLLDEKNNTIKTSLKKEDLKIGSNQRIELQHFKGCERFIKNT